MLKIKRLLMMVLIIFIILAILVLRIFDKKATPIIKNYANVQTKRIGIEVLRSVATKEVNKVIESNELFIVTKDDTGKIESIDFDTMVVNEALIAASKNVRARLKEIEKGKNLPEELKEDNNKDGVIFYVPIGIIFGNSFLSNSGPKIPVKIKYSGNVGLDIKTRVKEYGINSALIEIYIYIEVTQRTILPFSSNDVKLHSEIPIVMKVIKGDIPNYLTDYNKGYSLPIK